MLYALLALVPGLVHDENYLSMVGSGVTFVVFTVSKNLGNTLELATQGFLGTFVACFYAHVMNALMPLGARGDHFDPLLAHAMLASFIVVVLWLDMTRNATMFMLCYHCYFAMEFVNPQSQAAFNTSWAVERDAYTTTTMVTAAVGVIAAVAATLLPTPIRATKACRGAAKCSVIALTGLVADLAAYYDGDRPTVNIYRLEAGIIR